MKTTVTENDFVQAFQDIRPENFSVQALQAMFDFFEELEEGGEEMELDVIAICCEFSEYDVEELEDSYSHMKDDEEEELSIEEWAELLRDHTMVIELDESIVIQCF